VNKVHPWGPNAPLESETTFKKFYKIGLTTGDEIRQPSQSQIGGWVVRMPLVSRSFMLLPQCRIDLFQSLAVSLPEMYWNSLGVNQAPWNKMQGPLEPWQSLWTKTTMLK
jgi:hypothetical protein